MTRHEGILLVVPALPAGVTHKALKQFVRSGLADAGFQRLGLATALCRCAIVRVTDLVSGRTRLQGLVHVWPARAAMAAIRTLGGRELLGKPMQVRRYVHGSRFGSAGALRPPSRKQRRCELRIELVDR